MRRVRATVFVAFLCLVLWSGGARAEDAAIAPTDRDAIQKVIRDQMEAFRRDDGPAAFAYATPNLQTVFHDPETFMAMVRRGYQPVYRPRATGFGALDLDQGRIVQRVEIVGPDGSGHEALYFMERQPDGSWRIAGCALTDHTEVTT